MKHQPTSDKRAEIIAAAILNKFNEWPIDELFQYVNSVSNGALTTPELADQKIFDDIKLQLLCFDKLESDWSNRTLSFELLEDINALVRGDPKSTKLLRSTNHVPDFGGETPTDVVDIPSGILTIKKILAALASVDDPIDHNELAAALAEAFCIVINVHPFEDGNGRTARFLIQLVLKRAGFEYIELPKFRNDPEWRLALTQGTTGNYKRVEGFLKNRLKPLLEDSFDDKI